MWQEFLKQCERIEAILDSLTPQRIPSAITNLQKSAFALRMHKRKRKINAKKFAHKRK